jgi:two-component system, cell cycle sensor histidine kinase and response regulator CckA
MRLATEHKGADEPGATSCSAKSNKNSGKASIHETAQPSTANPSPPLQNTQHFALAARATNDAVRVWDVKTRSLSWPQGLENLLAYTSADTRNHISFWEERIHPEDRARTTTSIAESLRSTTEHWSGEYRFRRADGTYVHLLERALIVRDHAGAAQQFVGSLMDITARKQLQDQLLRSQKMDAFGQLAGGAAHDFNNFLTTILGYSDLALDSIGAKSKAASHIMEIRAAAGRASTLTSQLLAFSRKNPLEPRIVEVNSVIVNMERSLLRLLGENISVVCHLHTEEEGAHIRVDPGQLTQVLLNLAVNARDAMPDEGQLVLTTSTAAIQSLEENEAPLQELSAGDYVVISVADNGVGMDEKTKAHLFEPFFTTKDQGSGLGLATSYGIIRQSGGSIQIESEPHKGTTVQIYLPKVAAPECAYRKRNGKMPTGTETIIVLEDDISVRHMSVRLLRNLGYNVIEAATSDDAQRVFTDANDRKIHLLLTDMVMPQMSGRSFADWLRTASPETRVIFASGYLEESLPPGERPDPEMFFLAKPFSSEQLACKVREALDQPPLVRL